MIITEELQERYFNNGITAAGKDLLREYVGNHVDNEFRSYTLSTTNFSEDLRWLFENRGDAMEELIIKERLNGRN